MDELKRIHPEVELTLSSGEVISVSPVSFRKLGKFGEALFSIHRKLSENGIDVGKLSLNDTASLTLVLSLAFDEVVRLMAFVLGKDEEWFDSLSPVDGISLLEVMYKQNWNDDVKKKLEGILLRMQSASTS